MVVLSEDPPNNFRDVSVYPTQDELLGSRKFFRKNIIDGRFRDVDHYLDVQFRLLREDFVANLREEIDSYRSNRPNVTKKLEIYQNTKINRERNWQNVECLKISISNIDDDNDKKFMKGSLLLFTRNNFDSIFMAKVVHKNSIEGHVTIELIDDDLDLQWRYIMAECGNYFDPYFNVLSALQTVSVQNFPMEKYLVHLNTSSVYMPKYILHSGSKYDIDGYKCPPELLPQIRTNLLGLNSPQFEAFKAALTQEFVVIQGPPGTGKTHLGVKIAAILVRNYQFWHKNTPLLIISHKNDALDQFLEGLMPTTDRLIRVGGQSKSSKLQSFNLNQYRKEEHLKVMQNSLVVGMTTSIAARWKDYLERLKPPIVIVEEAAEVLEAHVIAALTNHCQHLILMGDHQQLQPFSADHNIGKNCHLGISLFERMIRNQVQHYQLKIQHRMRPEISSLLKMYIYPFLEDHESVNSRPNIHGVEKNVFFIDHKNKEETLNTTKKNSFEARFLACFARYLVLNRYGNGEIVILGAYAAQVQELDKLVRQDQTLKSVKVSTLDGFQGQESDIVLLSLVRSDAIGFLAQANRVCVALSRARNGFYIMGNMNMLAKSCKLWSGIRKCLEDQNSIGGKLRLRCQRHNMVTELASLDDFWKVQNGGCCKRCEVLLTCGHVCVQLCHNEPVKHKCENMCLGITAVDDKIASRSYVWRSSNQLMIAEPEPTYIDQLVTGICNGFKNLWCWFKGLFQ